MFNIINYVLTYYEINIIFIKKMRRRMHKNGELKRKGGKHG